MLSSERVSEIEAAPWFYRADSPYLIVDTDLRVRAVNTAYEVATDHPRSLLVGERLFDVFPDNPADPLADGVSRLSASLESVFSAGERRWMGVLRHDVPDLWQPGRFRHKVWAPVNSPIHQDGRTVGAVHHAEDVTAVVDPARRGVPWARLEESARALGCRFPELAHETVVGTLAQSLRVVMAAAGGADTERAEALATVRLELLAGHPALG